MTSKQEALLKPSSTEEKVEEKYSHRRFGRKPTNEKENGIANKVAHGGFTAHGYSDFSSSRKAMLMSIAAFLLYTIIGTVVFANWVDGWSTVDALYYTVATFTTVGYGDLSPVTPGQRVFGIFFAIFGIIVLGNVALGIVFDQLINSFQKARKENANSTKRNLMNKFEQKSMSNSSMKNGLGSDDGKSEGKHPDSSSLRKEASPLKEEEKEQRLWLNSITNLVLVAVGIILPAVIIGIIEGWSVIDILYFASITATTIGYGDLSPQTLSTRLIAVFYLPFCISIMAKIFSDITTTFMEKRAQEAEEEFYDRKLTKDDLKAMDIAKNGDVSVGEFLEFMLVTMNKVDSEDIKELKDLYSALDTDADGSLTLNDLHQYAYGEDMYDDKEDEEGGNIQTLSARSPDKEGYIGGIAALWRKVH